MLELCQTDLVKLVLLQLSPAPDHAGHHLDTVLVLEQPYVQFENAENVGKISQNLAEKMDDIK